MYFSLWMDSLPQKECSPSAFLSTTGNLFLFVSASSLFLFDLASLVCTWVLFSWSWVSRVSVVRKFAVLHPFHFPHHLGISGFRVLYCTSTKGQPISGLCVWEEVLEVVWMESSILVSHFTWSALHQSSAVEVLVLQRLSRFLSKRSLHTFQFQPRAILILHYVRVWLNNLLNSWDAWVWRVSCWSCESKPDYEWTSLVFFSFQVTTAARRFFSFSFFTFILASG